MATPLVGIIMGSQSDWATMKHVAETLDQLKANLREAIELLGTLSDIGHKNLVFSTVGDRRVFERLPRCAVKPALALSLHTTNAELRAQLLPRAPRIDPAELVELGGAEGAEVMMWLTMRGALSSQVKKVHQAYTLPSMTGIASSFSANAL